MFFISNQLNDFNVYYLSFFGRNMHRSFLYIHLTYGSQNRYSLIFCKHSGHHVSRNTQILSRRIIFMHENSPWNSPKKPYQLPDNIGIKATFLEVAAIVIRFNWTKILLGILKRNCYMDVYAMHNNQRWILKSSLGVIVCVSCETGDT